MTPYLLDPEYQTYKLLLSKHGVVCPTCNGRCGIGSSFGGVTLSWRECPRCEGLGEVLSEEYLEKCND